MLYHEIINHIENMLDKDIVWKLKCTMEHEGPLITYHPN